MPVPEAIYFRFDKLKTMVFAESPDASAPNDLAYFQGYAGKQGRTTKFFAEWRHLN